MASLNPFLDAIQQVAQTIPVSGMDALCWILDQSDEKPPQNVLLQSVTLPNHRMAVMNLLKLWKFEGGGIAPKSLALALRTAARGLQSRAKTSSEALVWTGPSAPGLRLRRIDQALLEVIQAAQTELLLVTFAAYKVPLIIEALQSALRRGVNIRFVAESANESHGKISFSAKFALGADLASSVQVYVWPFDKRTVDHDGKFGSLHAKCVVADRNILLMSSANLTDHALSLNMEMGLLVSGGDLPGRVVDIFTFLIQNQTLLPE